jgi:hypothetical protein
VRLSTGLVLAVVGCGLLMAAALGNSSFGEARVMRERSEVVAIGTATIEHWLLPDDFNALGTPIAPDFGVTSGGAVVFKSGGIIRIADPARAPLPQTFTVAFSTMPDSFALDARGTLMTAADGYFGAVDPNDAVLAAVPLPLAESRLAPSVHEGATYAFGSHDVIHRAYRFIDDGSFQLLLDAPEPIVAVADDASNIYAATATAIVRLKAGEADVLFRAPADFAGPIRSITVTEEGIVFFATDARVYALLGDQAISIVNNAGGNLRIRNGTLYVLDPQRRLLFTLRPASGQLFAGGTS